MKKFVAMLMVLMMMLSFGAAAYAAGGPLTLEQAKQAALDYVGVKASEATFTKAHRDYDDGRAVYEIEFYVGQTEYEMNVDVNTGRITDFSTDYHGRGGYGFTGRGYVEHDWDDVFDYDDAFDFDDDFFDWD